MHPLRLWPLGSPRFPSLCQDEGLEALTPEGQESLHFLLNTLATLQGTEDRTIMLRPWEAQGHQGRPRVGWVFLFRGAQMPLYRQGNAEQAEDPGVRWGGQRFINQAPSEASSYPLVTVHRLPPAPSYQIWHHYVKSHRVVAVFLPPSSGSDSSANDPTISSRKPGLPCCLPTWIWGALTKRVLWSEQWRPF